MIYPTPRAAIIMAIGLPVTILLALVVPGLWIMGLVWCGGVTFLILLDFIGAVSPKNLSLRVAPPAQLYIGEGKEIDITLTSRSKRILKGPELRLSTNDRLHVAPETVSGKAGPGGLVARFRINAIRRGDGHIRTLWTRWTGPMGLGFIQTTQNVDHSVAVTPNTRLVRETAMDIFSRDAVMGQKIQKLRGEGTEFDALSEFQPGMDKRAIDWKHSARHHTLLVKEFQTERNHNIIFALDSGHLMCEPLDGLTKLDRAINASLLMAYVSLKIGDRVGYFGFDETPYLFTEPVAGTQSFPHLQMQTAKIDYSISETNFTLSLSRLYQKLRRRALIVIFTDFVDTTSAELMLENVKRLTARHAVIFVTFKDTALEDMTGRRPDALTDMTRAVIADKLLQDRELVLARLQRLGVHIIDTDAKHLNMALLNRFLALKAKEAL